MKKRNLVTVIVVLFMCVAVYLNFNTQTPVSDEVRVSDTLGEETSAVNEEEKNEEEVKDVTKYFEEARLEKQKARDTAITTLKAAVGEENISQSSRDRAAESIETISTGAVSETRIETLVKAKGYRDCVALINDSGVNVIVTAPAEGLTAGDTTKIKDIVVSETNVLPSQIKIIEIK
ncbi:MAG: SpoIIIAH-like family protein [Oscillospiraceae bacterium]|nr:SpoIIIAH-like family protein [Oscillospiraceae bacterium]